MLNTKEDLSYTIHVFKKTSRKNRKMLERTQTLWTHLTCEGQGSNIGVSSWDTFSDVHSSCSSISVSILAPDHRLEPGSKVRSCCRRWSCCWTPALPWREGHHENSPSPPSVVAPWCLPLWSDPDQLLCTTSTPVPEEPPLFAQRARISTIFKPLCMKWRRQQSYLSTKPPDLWTSAWTLWCSCRSLGWYCDKFRNEKIVWHFLENCNFMLGAVIVYLNYWSVLILKPAFWFLSPFIKISLANSSHNNVCICT